MSNYVLIKDLYNKYKTGVVLRKENYGNVCVLVVSIDKIGVQRFLYSSGNHINFGERFKIVSFRC